MGETAFGVGADIGGADSWSYAFSQDISIGIVSAIELCDQAIDYLTPTEIPGPGDILECYLMYTMSKDETRAALLMNGCDPKNWNAVLQSRRRRLDDDQLIQFARRSHMTDAQISAELEKQGWIRQEEADARVALYDQLPDVSDVLHFLQRNVFDAQYVADYGLLDGYNERFYPRYGPGLRALGVSEQTIKDHYASHWINPSIGQLAEMVMRLRPGRVDPTVTFTTNDFLRVLAEQDVAPYFRQRLLATAYRVIPLRQLNQATQQGAYDEAELFNRWQDIGFSSADARTMAHTSLIQAARQVEAQIRGYTASLVSEMAQYRLIDLPTAVAKLTPLGYTAEQVQRLIAAAADRRLTADRKKHDEGTVNDYAKLALTAYEDGAISRDNAAGALHNAGYSDGAASLALSTVDLRVQKATIDLAIASIHRAFRLGATDGAGALNALQLAGVQPQMASTLAQRWQLEMSIPRVAASTQLILRLTKKGIMSVTNAMVRLTNLGWSPGDIDLQLAEVNQSIQQAQGLASAKRAKDLAIAQKAAQKALKDTQRGFCKLYTPARMVKWYALRIIDDATFLRRLEQCGTSPGDADALLAEASVARASKDAKANKSGAAGVEYTGPGAVPGGPAN